MTLSRCLTVIAAAMLAAAPAARAQSFTHLGVAAGAAVPMSGLGDRATTGYNLALSLDVRAPLTPLSLRVEGMFNEFDYSSNADNVGSLYRTIATSARVFGVTANGILASSGTLSPYLIGGAGYYRRTEPNLLTGGTSSENDLGANVGVGVRFDLVGFTAYGEARYHWAGDSDVRFVPITVGVNF